MSPNNSFIKWVYFSWFQAIPFRFGLLLLGSSLLIPLFCFVLNLCWWHLHERVRWETTHMGTTPNMTPPDPLPMCAMCLSLATTNLQGSFGWFYILGWFQMKFASKLEPLWNQGLGFPCIWEMHACSWLMKCIYICSRVSWGARCLGFLVPYS